jgi:PLP dependent protein
MSTTIATRVRRILSSLPTHVTLVAAAKTRSCEEVLAALDSGVGVVGHNYVQEADAMISRLGHRAATWSMIGRLQRNKAKRAVRLFDSIQTVDSLRLAVAIDRHARSLNRIMPILIEVNAGREPQKAGVHPEDLPPLIREIASLSSLRIDGLMTMGPWVADPESLRPIFRETRALLDQLASDRLLGEAPHVLSMGMSGSYQVAVEEGATMVRLGTSLFGPRT